MFRQFFQNTQITESVGNQPVVFNISNLKDNERLEFKYTDNNKLIAIQKIKLSRLNQSIEARAETDINSGESGRVFYSGTYWTAVNEGDTKIVAGSKVLVKARHNLTLFVMS